MALQQLKDLAAELNVRGAGKLYQLARRRGIQGATTALAKEAVSGDVGRQVQAPPPRSTGKSAAEGPNQRLQADLLDFSKNARAESGAKYALLLTDVYTREARTYPLMTKEADEVNTALGPLVQNLADGRKDVVLTTDKGKEFNKVEEALPDAVHRHKEGKNDIAVADRLGQTLKQDLAAVAARKGGDWDKNLDQVENAYNERPHEAVFGAPEDVEINPRQEFYVLKANADRFMQNRAQSERRMDEVKATKTIRAPVNAGGRSFNPQYGDPLKARSVKSDFVTTTGGRKVLLKEAQAVPEGSTRAAARLTDPSMARRSRMQADADLLEAHLIEGGGSARVADLARQVRQNALLPSLKHALTRAHMTLRGFLRTYDNMFRTGRGVVTVINAPPAPAEDPEPDTPAFRALPLAERLRITDARNAERREARARANTERLRGLASAYAPRPAR